ncbi:MAG TPA: GNAT family N-acetyltransferase [Acidimicrobiia bacterium]|nr:GNAT family N-acetyltransferase [Acidimicrobiia bacterium]
MRLATEEDWPSIWSFFEAIVREGETYTYPADLMSEAGRSLWMEPSPGKTVVLEDRGTIVGSAKMGPNRPGPGDHIGTASFMVAPEARGRGVGRLPGEYAIDWLRGEGYRGIQFNAVVEANTAAVKLWESLGFQIVGTVPGAFRSPTRGLVSLHIMYLPLR